MRLNDYGQPAVVIEYALSIGISCLRSSIPKAGRHPGLGVRNLRATRSKHIVMIALKLAITGPLNLSTSRCHFRGHRDVNNWTKTAPPIAYPDQTDQQRGAHYVVSSSV